MKHLPPRPVSPDELEAFVQGLYRNYPEIRAFEMTHEALEQMRWMVSSPYVAYDSDRKLYLFQQTVSNSLFQLKDGTPSL